jgi:thiosulfate/3-mercaptopyruvate sulfurtransferase
MSPTPAAFTTLIGVDALRSLQAGPNPPLVLDASFELGDVAAGVAAYAAGHLPGSRYVHLDRDLCAEKTGRNGRHPLPDRAAFARTAGALGVTPASQVVALDRNGGMYAARLWWMLRWLGHAEVAVLDGGYKAWVAGGGEPSTEPVARVADAPAYPERPPLAGSIEVAVLSRRLGRAMVLDARSAERFRGEKEPIDPVAGRIPGAFNRFHGANLLPGGLFKPAAALRAELQALLGTRAPGEVIHSCGSGVTACHNLLAMEHAGLAGSLLYPGSWSEWSADPARPIARG